MKKILAVLLAAIMLLSVIPFSFAEDVSDADATVAEWKTNDALLIEKLLDELTYAHYQYVIDNNSSIKTKMDVMTAFGLYDNAWINYATKTVNVDTCKAILLSLIEAYQADFGEDYVADIKEVLEGAQDAMDLVEKVSKYTDKLDFVNSDTWGSINSTLDIVIKAANTFEEVKDSVIKAYSEIISVQMANGYYLDLLDYIANDASIEYQPIKTAAAQLKTEATTAIEDQLAALVDAAVKSQSNKITSTIINLVADTNVYTATAKKIYDIGTKVADILWNSNDLYAHYDNLVASFWAETSVDAYATEALAADDSEKTIFAVNALLSTRNFGENSLYNLLEAEAQGVIGKIQKQLGVVAVAEYVADLAELDLMEKVLFNDAYAKGTVFGKIAKVYCPVNMVGYADNAAVINAEDGQESVKANDYGAAIVRYNGYSKDYVKVMFLAESIDKVTIIGTDDGYVTYVEYVDEDGVINDYSFTQIQLAKGDKINVVDKAYTGVIGGEAVAGELNDVFVVPEPKEITAKDVAEATVAVAKDEATSFIEKIKAFFENLFASLKKLFNIG